MSERSLRNLIAAVLALTVLVIFATIAVQVIPQ
jgi:hypothetical protein